MNIYVKQANEWLLSAKNEVERKKQLERIIRYKCSLIIGRDFGDTPEQDAVKRPEIAEFLNTKFN